MSKYKEYESLKAKVEEGGGKVGAYQEINYGIQFDVKVGDYTSKVRIYESKKKGITVDLSQVKHQVIKNCIAGIQIEDIKAGRTSTLQSDCFEKPLIGVDESGKGDYFGPLVVAAVYADASTKEKLVEYGVADSKKLTDKQIKELAKHIKVLCDYEVLVISNPTYNKLYHKIQNLNVLLAKGHAKVIETLAKKTSCTLALSDQFAKGEIIQKELEKYSLNLTLEERPKAESNVVVAAASVLAREAFVLAMEALETKYGQTLPKGAGGQTLSAAKRFVGSHGMDSLGEVAKLHFKTTDELR